MATRLTRADSRSDPCPADARSGLSYFHLTAAVRFEAEERNRSPGGRGPRLPPAHPPRAQSLDIQIDTSIILEI